MAVTLGSTSATQGADFSTPVSGLLVQRQLVNNAGEFSLLWVDETTGTLVARGSDLMPGIKTVVIETADGKTTASRTRTSFDITVAAATAPVVPVLALTITSRGPTVDVSVVATGVPSGSDYRLIDARSQNQIRETDYGLSFNRTTGALTGVLQPGTGLYDIVIVAMKNGVEVVRTRRFSVYAYAGVNPTPTPAPSFTTQPSISPTSGNVGAIFTATDGVATNTNTALTRRWLLNGTAIGTGTTVVPVIAGSLVLEVTATGAGGSTVATSAAVTVSDVAQPYTPSLDFSDPRNSQYYGSVFV